MTDELWRVTMRYARAVDRRRPGEVAALFAPDGLLRIERPDRPAVERRGHAEIEAAMGRLSAYRSTTHILGQHMIDELDEAAGIATAETYCMAHHISDGPPAVDHVMAIRYLDRFARIDDAWRFAERRLVVGWTADLPIGPN